MSLFLQFNVIERSISLNYEGQQLAGTCTATQTCGSRPAKLARLMGLNGDANGEPSDVVLQLQIELFRQGFC